MCHRWGWHPATLTDIVQRAGFVDIKAHERPQWHGSREARDMRLVAVKR
jgi:hypothetical protein